MKIAIAILAVLSLVALADQVAVDLGPLPELDADWLAYDDGTPFWVFAGITYRGVWFNVEDFTPGMDAASVLESEMWFYHHSNQPWDTSDAYIEIWNGDAMAPTDQLDQTMVTAVHYQPQYGDYSAAPIVTEANFWCIGNFEMSSNGTPSSLADQDQGILSEHSFQSDDFIVWELNNKAVNYMTRVYADLSGAFSNTTWASVKATF